jgi:hypothetical protein
MRIAENRAQLLLSKTLAARDSMQTFFTNWLEGNQLEEEWQRYKKTASREMNAFLQDYAAILTGITGKKHNWIEHSIRKLEELEKLQLRQHFLTAHAIWDTDSKKQIISLPHTKITRTKCDKKLNFGESPAWEAMIFMPEIVKNKTAKLTITDVLRKGLTNTRAFLNILNLSEKFSSDSIHGQLEVHLQIFKNQINLAQQKANKALLYAIDAYKIFLNELAKILTQTQIYKKANDAHDGIVHMADFLWSKNYERASIHIQHASKDHASLIVFEPRLVKGSGSKEALWVKKLEEKHPWIKNLPWQVLQRPQPLINRDGEGLKIDKATLVLVKKTYQADGQKFYAVDCIPVGELGGIPVPFAMDDPKERYKVTLANQKGIYLGSQTHDDKPPFLKLEEVIFTQLETLKPILTAARCKKGITIPLADINLTQRVFSHKGATANWRQDRADANQAINDIIKRYAIYYDYQQVKYAYLDRTAENFIALAQKLNGSEHYIPIHLEFYDPTITYHYPNIFSANEDVNSLKASLKIAIERLEMLKEKIAEQVTAEQSYLSDIKNIGTIQNFLQSRSVGLYQLQGIPENVLEATRRLSEKLRQSACLLGNNTSNYRNIQIELLKILQSSLVIKKASFESMLGFLRRTVDSAVLDALLITPGNKSFKNALTSAGFAQLKWSLLCLLMSPFFAAGWILRLALMSGATLLKMPYAIYYQVQKLLGVAQNKSGQLAASIGIFFSATGKKKLNSKNAADHALSVLLMICAMIDTAINGELVNGRVPLMTDGGKNAAQKAAVNEAIQYQQMLKATGLQIV